jgi:hypothetical protein
MFNTKILRNLIRDFPEGNKVKKVGCYVNHFVAVPVSFKPVERHSAGGATRAVFKDQDEIILRLLFYLFQLVQ